MSSTLRLTNLARVAALSMAFALPLAGVAYADDEYGTGHESVIRQAAASHPSASLSVAQTKALDEAFKVGQNDAFGAARSSQLAPVTLGSPSRVASMGRSAGSTDLVGSGGAQDALAVEIYHPGSGTQF